MKIKQSKKGHIYTEIELPGDISPGSAREIGEQIVNYIIDRTKDGKGAGGKAFPGYSKAYINSLDFQIAGKSADDVNLTLSSELLDSIKVLSIEGRRLRIGYDEGDDRNNPIAEGNIIGSYGKPRGDSKKARNFMELQSKEIEPIVNEFKQEPIAQVNQIVRQRAAELVRDFLFDMEGE